MQAVDFCRVRERSHYTDSTKSSATGSTGCVWELANERTTFQRGTKLVEGFVS